MKITYWICLLLLFAACQSKPQTPQKVKLVKQTEKKEIDSIKITKKFKALVLKKRLQSLNDSLNDSLNVYETSIHSPKSVIYSQDGSKFYINSLEGYTTAVFDAKTLKKIKEIEHRFNEKNAFLFKNNENTAFDYKFKQKREQYNIFLGKPVESCLSHNGKYLWVTYYRRNWDENAESPSAVAIIDTNTDSIVRVIPSGPLPKMIACSPDNKFIAVTHWGDNTVGIIDISSNNVQDFKYIAHPVVDYRLEMNYNSNQSVDRDNECGNCLRGTVFSPDAKFLLIAKMGGNGIAVIDTKNFNYLGTIGGMKNNLRHMIINNNNLILSSNKFGVVQKAKLNNLLNLEFKTPDQVINYNQWESVTVGLGARTIDITPDGKYIFACVNNDCKIAVIQTDEMKNIYSIPVAKFPVGMAISPNGKQLIVTSQGKSSVPLSGNVVTIFDVIYDQVK